METDKIKQMLGQPYYEAPGCLIYCGDCVALMHRLNDEIINLTVTSPPYNIGKDYEQNLPLADYIIAAERIDKLLENRELPKQRSFFSEG